MPVEHLSVKVHNKTTSTITGLKVAAAWVDAVDDVHLARRNLTSDAKIKAGKVKDISWSEFGHRSGATGWVVVVQKVLFDDGSTWEPGEGAPACIGQWRQKGRAPVAYLPPVSQMRSDP